MLRWLGGDHFPNISLEVRSTPDVQAKRSTALPFRPADVGDVGIPHLVDPREGHTVQQVGIGFVALARLAQLQFGVHGFQSHQLQQPSLPVATHPVVIRKNVIWTS